MDVYDAMRTTFAARDYTDEQVSDEILHRILDNARFAPSGGNRQGWKVLIVKDKAVRRQLKGIMAPTIKQYKAEAMAGETPFNTINPSQVSQTTISNTSANFPLVDDLEEIRELITELQKGWETLLMPSTTVPAEENQGHLMSIA